MNQYIDLISISEYKKYLESFLDQETILDMYKLHYKLSIYYLNLYPYRKVENELLSIFKENVIKDNKYMVMDDYDNLLVKTMPIILRKKYD